MAAYNVKYPMTLGAGGLWLTGSKPVLSRVKFLVDFSPGQYLGYTDWGTNLSDLEESSFNLDHQIKLEALELRTAITNHISDMQLLSIIAVNDTSSSNRSLSFYIQYTDPNGQVQQAQFLNSSAGLALNQAVSTTG